MPRRAKPLPSIFGTTPRSPQQWSADRLALFGCLVVGLIVGIAQATGYIADPYDARAYWEAVPSHLYFAHWTGGYVYPPPMALGLNVLHFISWPIYITAFTTATWLAFWYVTRAFAPIVLLASLALVPYSGGTVVSYLFLGNVQFIMAAAIVASIRLSSAWAIVPLLTKLVPVSFVWFAIRREWRSFGVAVGLTGAVVAITFVVAPGIWFDFVRFLTTNMDASPLPMVPIAYPVRLLMAVALTAWGGLTNRRWTVPIAAGLAIPALYTLSYVPVWLGVIGIEWPLRLPQAFRVVVPVALRRLVGQSGDGSAVPSPAAWTSNTQEPAADPGG